jgi:hypothetical protein
METSCRVAVLNADPRSAWPTADLMGKVNTGHVRCQRRGVLVGRCTWEVCSIWPVYLSHHCEGWLIALSDGRRIARRYMAVYPIHVVTQPMSRLAVFYCTNWLPWATEKRVYTCGLDWDICRFPQSDSARTEGVEHVV